MKIFDEISRFLKQDLEITDYNVEECIKTVNKMNVIVCIIVLIIITIVISLAYFLSPIGVGFIVIIGLITLSFPAKIMRKINSFSFYKREKSMGVQQKKIPYKNTDVCLLKKIDTYTSDNIPICIVEEYMSEYNYSFKNIVNTTTKFSIEHEFKSVIEGSKYFDEYSEANVLDFINKMHTFAQSINN